MEENIDDLEQGLKALMRCSLGFGILIITKFKTEAAAH
jgi:hypothetical protein